MKTTPLKLKLPACVLVALVHLITYSIIFVDMNLGPVGGYGIAILAALAGYVLFRTWESKVLWVRTLKIATVFLPVIFILLIGLLEQLL